MSGPGDIEGEVSGDEAAWRDLIARFDSPSDEPRDTTPWPAREDLPADADGSFPGDAASADPAAGDRAAGDLAPGSTAPRDLSPRDLSPRDLSPRDVTPRDLSPRDLTPGDLTPGGLADGDPFSAPDLPGPHAGGQLPALDHARVIRPAGDPRSYSPAEEEDEPYVPVPLPPPAKLDPLSKAAWVGVVGGPAYLLVASLIMHWSISAAEAFVAVAAFIGGFATLVIKLGDHPRDDDDNGAVL